MPTFASRIFSKCRGPLYSAAFLGLWIFLPIYVRRFDPHIPVELPGWLVPIGLIIAAAGALIAAVCILTFAKVGRGTPAFIDPPQQFVALGPYRYVRNPMYLGATAMILGSGLIISSESIALLALCFLVLMHLFVVLYEEKALAARFGETYLRYKATVPRWLLKI